MFLVFRSARLLDVLTGAVACARHDERSEKPDTHPISIFELFGSFGVSCQVAFGSFWVIWACLGCFFLFLGVKIDLSRRPSRAEGANRHSRQLHSDLVHYLIYINMLNKA